MNNYTFLYENNKSYESRKDLLSDIIAYIYQLITQETWYHNLYETFMFQPDTPDIRCELAHVNENILKYTERISLEIYQTDIIHDIWKTNPENIYNSIKKLYEMKKHLISMEKDFE